MKLPHPPLLSQESSAMRWRRGGSCSLTIILRGAGSERDPLPSKSQNLCPFLATSTRVVWGFASLKTFIFTNSFVSLLLTILRAFVLNTKDCGEEHVKAILLLCHWINRGHSECFTGIHCELLFLILDYTWFTVLNYVQKWFSCTYLYTFLYFSLWFIRGYWI